MGFNIGPLFIRYYGIILMSGAVAGAFLAAFEAKRRGEDPEIVWDGLTWALIGGVLGARLWHIFTPPPSMVAAGITTQYYLTHPLDALAIWKGGLGLPGAVLGGMLALYWFTKRNGFNFGLWTDIAAPAVALGQAIGRWGNYVNQELYGLPTDLPWGIYIEAEGGYFHPVFLYESLWNLANMFLLLWLARKFADRLHHGDIFLVYLLVYPIGRFLLEFLRLDSALIAGINANQALMLLVAICAGVMLYLHSKKPPERTTTKKRGGKKRNPATSKKSRK